MIEIKKLDKEAYKGYSIDGSYVSEGCYDAVREEMGMAFRFAAFPEPVVKPLRVSLFEDWLSDPVAFGAFDGERLAGLVVGSVEGWNNRFRLSDIYIEQEYRHMGIGGKLISRIVEEARQSGCRMVVLETQSCNNRAIACYRANGFELIGCDLYSYSNSDIEKREVRLEFGLKLD